MDDTQEFKLKFDSDTSGNAACMPHLNCEKPITTNPRAPEVEAGCYSIISSDSMASLYTTQRELPACQPSESPTPELFGSTDNPNIPSEGFAKMKIAIPKCDQSYIVGESALRMHRIMESTQTQIVFGYTERLDSEVSNEVALYGAIGSLEQARKELRKTIPFTLTFDIYLIRSMSDLHRAPAIQEIGAKLNIKLRFVSTVVKRVYRLVIQGTEEEVDKVKEVMKKLFPSDVSEIMKPVFRLEMPTSRDIVEAFIKEDIFKIVMANTATRIFFVQSSEADSQEAGKLIITGSVHDIYSARMELVGFMPVELVFEIDKYEQYTDDIIDLTKKYALQLTAERVGHSGALLIKMRGTERYIHNIYDAYKEVLQWKQDNQVGIPMAWSPEHNSSDWLSMESGSSSLEGAWNYFDLAHRSSTPNHFYAA